MKQTIPVEPAPPAAEHPELPKVLVVDDQADNRFLLEAVLSKVKAQVVSVGSGPEALSRLGDEEYAVVLLDVSMPEMNGFDVAEEIRRREESKDTPVIFVSGVCEGEGPVTQGYKIGAADFLLKPVKPDAVRSKVQVFLSLYERRKAQEAESRRLAASHEASLERRREAERAARDAARREAKLAEQNRELLRKNAELDSFAHVVSSDLRQPLQTILDYLQLVEDRCIERLDEDSTRWLQSGRRIGAQMQELIGDLLDLGSVGAKDLAMAPVDMNSVLRRSLDALLPVIRASGARVTYSTLPRVLGNERLLARVLFNLISNAIKYRGATAPRVQIGAERDDSGGGWSICVADNGRGIRPEDCSRVFEMFTRSPDAAGVTGSGIGLAICRKIVSAHGGRIWADSDLGQGSEFRFTLPSAGDGAADFDPEAPPSEEHVE